MAPARDESGSHQLSDLRLIPDYLPSKLLSQCVASGKHAVVNDRCRGEVEHMRTGTPTAVGYWRYSIPSLHLRVPRMACENLQCVARNEVAELRVTLFPRPGQRYEEKIF